jgi:hypothetical protein
MRKAAARYLQKAHGTGQVRRRSSSFTNYVFQRQTQMIYILLYIPFYIPAI